MKLEICGTRLYLISIAPSMQTFNIDKVPCLQKSSNYFLILFVLLVEEINFCIVSCHIIRMELEKSQKCSEEDTLGKDWGWNFNEGSPEVEIK